MGSLIGFRTAPQRTSDVRGERETATGFAQLIRDRLHWTAVEVPVRGQPVYIACAAR